MGNGVYSGSSWMGPFRMFVANTGCGHPMVMFLGTRPFKVILNKERGLNIGVSVVLMILVIFARTINL